MKKISTLITSLLVVSAMTLSVAGCGGNSGTAGTSSDADVLEVSSGPLTVEVPKDWSKFDKSSDPDSIKDPWVVGARDSETEMATQVRLTKNTGESPQADATNQAVLYGNVFAQSGNMTPRGTEAVEIKGADKAQVAYFEYVDADGDYWDGLFMSAQNNETGNVSTMELMSLRGEGISQDEAKEILANAQYDKSKE